MPFGLINAPATCQALVNDIFREYLDIFVFAYLDDILVYSKNEKDYIKHITLVLETLKKADMGLHPKKCIFHAKEIEFLGYILTQNEIKIDPAKVKAVLNWLILKTITEIQEFIGFANFYRRFIKGYLGIATPLTNFTKKDRIFSWTENE
jgi:hypothetical protein